LNGKPEKLNSNLIQKILYQELREKNLVYPFISDLTKREKTILDLRGQGKPLQFIANKLKVTRERIRQIETRAKTKIEFQAKIMDTLACRFKECLFDEQEVEQAFNKYMIKKGEYSARKLKWLEFSELLWRQKEGA